MREFSIVTIVKGRRKQLANLLYSIKASNVLPIDIQIVCMDELADIAIPEGLNVNIQKITDDYELPLAAARNLGFRAAKTANVIFIDVDCIVSPTLFSSLLLNLQEDTIFTAYPLYLPVLPDSGNYSTLINNAIPHPARESIPDNQPVDHLQFWSLIFAIQKNTCEKIGGFDESYTGYGAEDTDFAMQFHQAGVVLIFINDFVLHQYHDKYDPPLNYFDSIINNAKRYQQKWNILPMRSWLRAFEVLGLIKIDDLDKISVIQKPTDKQIKDSVSANPY